MIGLKQMGKKDKKDNGARRERLDRSACMSDDSFSLVQVEIKEEGRRREKKGEGKTVKDG